MTPEPNGPSNAPELTVSRLPQFIARQATIWRFCAGRLHDNNVTAMSAALSFRTIFALIPIIVLIFLAARSLGVMENSGDSLRRLLRDSGFAVISIEDDPDDDNRATTSPAASKPVNAADYIANMVAKVENKLTFDRLGPIGGALFIWTALTLLTTIEDSLNRIFGAPRSRAMARRLLLYWSTITLGPVALSAASYLGQKAINTVAGTSGLGWLVFLVGKTGPIVIGILLLAALYKLLPNTLVRFRPALGGAAVAVVLWLIAKWAFSLYVQRFVVKGNLYGVLGVFPLFMMWLNFSWLIFLFGAELAHTAANLSRMRHSLRDGDTNPGPSDLLAAAVAIAEPWSAGRGMIGFDDLAIRLGLPDGQVRWLVDRLVDAGFITAVSNGHDQCYAMARPPDRIAVSALRDIADPLAQDLGAAGDDPIICSAIRRVQSEVRTSLSDMTLAELISGPSAPSGKEAG